MIGGRKLGNIISLRDITVAFEGEGVLKGINLDIGDKEFVTLLGRALGIEEKPYDNFAYNWRIC